MNHTKTSMEACIIQTMLQNIKNCSVGVVGGNNIDVKTANAKYQTSRRCMVIKTPFSFLEASDMSKIIRVKFIDANMKTAYGVQKDCTSRRRIKLHVRPMEEMRNVTTHIFHRHPFSPPHASCDRPVV